MILNTCSYRGSEYPVIVIHSSIGVSITCTNGTTTFSSVMVDDEYIFPVSETGTWNITATYKEVTTTQSVIVSQVDTYDVYFYFYNINVVSGDTSKGTVSGTTSFTYLKKVSSQTVEITTTKTPASGYAFNGYTSSIGTISGTTLTIPANTESDITVTANWTVYVAPLRVGGTIFYIDSKSTGGTYKFYNQDGSEISSVKVGDTPYYYTVSGTPSKDKYYIAEQKSVVAACTSGASGAVRKYDDTNWCAWATEKGQTFDSSKIDVFSSASQFGSIGTGKRNTAHINSDWNTSVFFPAHNGVSENVTCWDFAKSCNENKVNGCDDWFVPSIREIIEIYDSGIWGSSDNEWFTTTKYGSCSSSHLWSSSAYSGTDWAWHWTGEKYSSMYYAYDRDGSGSSFFLTAIRSF